MKDWLKDLNDEEIKRLFRDDGALAKVPAELRERVLAVARQPQAPQSAPRPAPRWLKPALALAAAAIILVSGLLLLKPLLLPDGDGTIIAATTVPDRDLEHGYAGLTYDQGFVLYTAGAVDLNQDGAWKPAEIGAYVTRGERIRTGESSSCEIQFGDRAVVVVEERTEVLLEELDTRAGAADIGLSAQTGSLLHKVGRLVGGESFRVRTPVAVCGVRGTLFGVTADNTTGTTVSVKEGSVYVLPAPTDVGALRRRAREADRRIGERIERLLAGAPAVVPGEQLALAGAYLAATETGTSLLAREMDQALSRTAPGEPDLARLDRAVISGLSEIKAKTPERRSLSPEQLKKMEWLDRLTLIPIAYRDTARATPKPEKATGPALAKIEVFAKPADAMISLFGHPVGRGRFLGLAADGTRLEFDIGSSGYEDASLTVNVSAAGEKSFRLELKHLPEKTENKPAATTPTPVTISPSPSVAVTRTPPAPFMFLTEYAGNAYYLYPASVGWRQAKTLCEKNAGHLVTITSAGENKAIIDALHARKVKTDIWIGYTIAGKRSYTWVTGETSSFAYWEPGRPDNLNGNQEFVYMQNIPDQARWEDAPEDQTHWCILELEAAAGTSSQMPRYASSELLLEYEGHRYYLSRETTDWHSAKRICEQNGGHLVTITSGPENQAIIRALRSQRPDRNVWIGLTNEEQGVIWKWVTGDKLYYNYWDVTEPNNIDGLEHWAAFWILPRGDGSNADYHWVDLRKDERHYFIMEIDPPTAATTGPVGFQDDFSAAALDPRWRWVRENPSTWSLTRKPGYMTITSELGELRAGDNNPKNLLLCTPTYENFTIETRLEFSPNAVWHQAGILIYANDNDYLKADLVYDNGRTNIELMFEKSGDPDIRLEAVNVPPTFYLRIKKQANNYTGWYSRDGKNYTLIREAKINLGSTPRVGLFAYNGASSAAGVAASFDYFKLTYDR
jgi:regulation of enolase protein 1 (concanavalin A-like superfamily)